MRFEQQLATARQLVPAAGAADREMARVLERARPSVTISRASQRPSAHGTHMTPQTIL